MPKPGDSVTATQIGKRGGGSYVWTLCFKCSKGRWVSLKDLRRGECTICFACAQACRQAPQYDWSDLEQLYIDQGFSMKQIAIRKGCGATTVQLALDRLSIPRRSPTLAREMAREKRGFKPRYTKSMGYIKVKLFPDDFFFPMADKNGYVFEHRLVVAQHLGRCLQPWEKVHHKDGIKDHNVYRNLKLTTAGSHIIEHSKGYRDGYRQGYFDGQLKAILEKKQAATVA